jgi:F-type H+-transporting ATPase subunit epsilon
MEKTLHCDIVSPERSIFAGQVQFVSLTGSLGDLGIAPGHAPLLSGVKPGPVELRTAEGKVEVFYISGGFIEVQPRNVTFLVDIALRAHDLNEAAAEESRSHAQQAMINQTTEFEYTRATSQLAEAVAQLRTLRQIHKKMGQ